MFTSSFDCLYIIFKLLLVPLSCNSRTDDVFQSKFISSTLLLFSEGPAGDALSPLSPALQPLRICRPSTSTSNRSVALLSTWPHLPPLLCTTSGSILQWATPIQLVIPLQIATQPMAQKSLPKPATHKTKRKEGSRSGSWRWATAGRDSQLLRSTTHSQSTSVFRQNHKGSTYASLCLLKQSWSLLGSGEFFSASLAWSHEEIDAYRLLLFVWLELVFCVELMWIKSTSWKCDCFLVTLLKLGTAAVWDQLNFSEVHIWKKKTVHAYSAFKAKIK